jgi:hypothetical protein
MDNSRLLNKCQLMELNQMDLLKVDKRIPVTKQAKAET